MRLLRNTLCFGLLSTFAIGCGGSHSVLYDTASTSNSFADAYDALVETAPTFGARTNFLSNLVVTGNELAPLADISNTAWDSLQSNFFSFGTSPTTFKNFVTDIFDESKDQSVMNRARMIFLIACTLDTLANKTNGTYSAGAQSITIDNSVVGVCGSESDYSRLIGETINFEVSHLVASTNFDVLIDMPTIGNPFTTSQWMYIKNNSTTLNLLHIEDGSAGDGAEIQASSITFNKLTESGAYQMASKGTSGERLYRIFMDQTLNQARLFAYMKANEGATPTVSLSVASDFSPQTHIHLNMSWSGFIDDYAGTISDATGCVDVATLSLETGSSSNCIANNATDASNGIALSLGLSILDSAFVTKADTGELENKLPTFDASDFLSNLQL
jgi:hypothetical protein